MPATSRGRRARAAPTICGIINRRGEARMLEPSAAEGYLDFGPSMHLFGAACMQGDAGMRRIGEALDALSAETGATVQCCGLRGRKYVVLDCRNGAGAFRITSEVGVEVPLPWTASGRLLLGYLTADAIRAFVPPEDFRLPNGSVLPVQDFLDDVARARRDGCSETPGLANGFTRCQAAPIRNRDGVVDHTLCFVLPTDSDARRRATCLSLLRARAESLSHAGPARGGPVLAFRTTDGHRARRPGPSAQAVDHGLTPPARLAGPPHPCPGLKRACLRRRDRHDPCFGARPRR